MTGSSDGLSATAQAAARGLAQIPVQPDRAVACRGCGNATTAGIARVSGAWSVVDHRPIWHCDACTRTRLRDFESGLREPW